MRTTLHREKNWKIKVYADDHPPPHFHIQAPDGEAVVFVSAWLVKNSGVEDRPLKDAIAWAKKNEQKIVDDWHKKNPIEVKE